MLWYIEVKFCTWLCLTVLQFKFEYHHFASIFEGVMPLCELRIQVICSFSALFSYMLWHKEVKFCIWLCFNVLQIKFECHHFASIIEGVIFSFLNLEYRKYTVLCSFLLHALIYWAEIFSIHFLHWQLSWNFKFDFGFFNAFLFKKCYIKKAF